MISERDSICEDTELFFDSEEKAIDDFIRRLRLMKEIIESQKIRNTQKVKED